MLHASVLTTICQSTLGNARIGVHMSFVLSSSFAWFIFVIELKLCWFTFSESVVKSAVIGQKLGMSRQYRLRSPEKERRLDAVFGYLGSRTALFTFVRICRRLGAIT